MIANCVKIGMNDLKLLLSSLSPEVSVCIRGRHAVGKSEGTYQSAANTFHDFYKNPVNQAKYNWTYEQGMPVVERRLSQLTEGDLTGMPDLDSARKTTVFKPCDWLIDACERPVFLFLDERNRALPAVKQAVFQLMDSRAFYGHKLHPDTRVIVAENVGDIYTVEQCDPAEVSRAATVELAPPVDEWIEYASNYCHPLTIDFIRANPGHLEFCPDGQNVHEPGKKYPDRRSWFKLDKELQRLGLFDKIMSEGFGGPTERLFYILAASMCGIESALAWVSFAKTYQNQISAQDIVTSWPKAKKKIRKPTNELFVELASKMSEYLKNNAVTDDAARNIGLFMEDCPPESRMVVFGAVSSNTDLKIARRNMFTMEKYMGELIKDTINGERDLKYE